MFIGQMSPGFLAPVSAGSMSVRPMPAAVPAFHNVKAVAPITDGENQVPFGATGTVLGVSLDEVEVQFYSPKDVLAFAQKSDVQSG